MDPGISGRALRRAPWANNSPDILGSVLHLLPCLADRASLRSVCSAWRDAARLQLPPPPLQLPPPPLPLLVLPKFSFSSFSRSQEMTVVRRIPLPEAVAAEDARCVGSFEGWLVGAQPSRQCKYADGECFLLNAFSQDVVRLPHPCAFHFFDYLCKVIPIVNTSAAICCTIHERQYAMQFNKVVLSASPHSGSKCIVAATAARKLALWRPGMTSWCVCESRDIYGPGDIAFYKGKLYIVLTYTADLFSFELEKDDREIMVSRVERCVIVPLPPVEGSLVQKCNIVEWRGKLLLVVRYANGYDDSQNIHKVGIFALDFSTNPHIFTEINNLDDNFFFISSCSSKSFPACQYDGVEGDFVYFVNKDLQPTRNYTSFDIFVYNMRDAIMATFSVEIPEDNIEASERSLVWFFPSR